MDPFTVKSLVEAELRRGESFTNFHGITPATIRSFLVEPFAVTADPDDLETKPRVMWVVLQERRSPQEGYVIVYDPATSAWGVAEHADGRFTLVASAPTLAGALSGM